MTAAITGNEEVAGKFYLRSENRKFHYLLIISWGHSSLSKKDDPITDLSNIFNVPQQESCLPGVSLPPSSPSEALGTSKRRWSTIFAWGGVYLPISWNFRQEIVIRTSGVCSGVIFIFLLRTRKLAPPQASCSSFLAGTRRESILFNRLSTGFSFCLQSHDDP